MLRTVLPALLTLPAMGAAVGQCQFTSVALQNYGLGCGFVFSVPPSITAQLDPVTCTLGIRVTAFAGCCNYFTTIGLSDDMMLTGELTLTLQ